MTKSLKEKGKEKKELSDWINGTLNNINKDAIEFNIRHEFNIDWTHLTRRQLRETLRRLKG